MSYVDKSHCIAARYGGAEIQNSLSRGQRTMVFEPAAAEKSQTFCACDDRRNCTGSAVSAPVRVGEYGSGGQGSRIYSVHGKTICLTGNGGSRGGQVGIYKIDLPDGDYIVRKLTPVEAERCQTLPDNYTAFGVDDSGKTVNISNTRRYKAAGNDRTVEIIAHILSFADWGGINIAYIKMPSDLTKIKSRLIFGLSKRQLICFGSAVIIGLPAYFFTRSVIGTGMAVFLMIGLMSPFFLLAMYERDGLCLRKKS